MTKINYQRFLEGKLKYLTLFLAGGVADLAHAPFYFFPALFLSLPIFFKALNEAKTKRAAFFTGWWYGFGYFVFGLYWIANSLLVDLRFAWLIPFSVAGIPFGLAIFIGLMAWVYKIITSRLDGNVTYKVILFSALWLGFEFLRSIILTGFPWNLIGYTALFSNTFAQLASVGSVYLLSFFVVIIALIPSYYKSQRFTVMVLVLISVSFSFGIIHLQKTKAEEPRVSKILILQPNIKQSLKWDPAISKLQFIDNVEMTKSQNFKDKDLVLWPETGVPYFVNNQPWVEDILKSIAPEKGLFVSGGLRSNGLQGDDYKVWNTLYAISRDGIHEYYDKMHLVPFGEYVPLRKYLPIDKITPGNVDFSKGKTRNLISYGSAPSFLSLICYEVIFPEYSASSEKPEVIINITNDGWFGNSTGPYQHLAMAQTRAIEQGVPVLRAANTGVSAVIDHNGKILQSLAYGKKGFIEADLPLVKTETLYSKYGDYVVLWTVLLTLIIALIFRKKY